MSFFGELKRRKVFQVAAVYSVVSWLLVQIVSTIEEPLRLPDWFDTSIVVLLAAGFPITLIVSWAFDMTSDGLVRDRGGTSMHQRGHGIELLLTALLLCSVAWIGYREFGVFSGPPSDAGDRISIAVLPLDNTSGDPEQEPISDGMTDEISFALSKIDGLELVGRTSAFQFKNEARDLREIGRALRATHLLEGSVQVAGTQVRITLSLIRADSGIEVWARRFFESEMTNVFSMQERIAREVASALQVPLGLRTDANFSTRRSIDDGEGYLTYLKAAGLFHSRGLQNLKEAARLLEELVELYPNDAPSWAMLAQAYNFIPNFEPDWFSGNFEALRSNVATLMRNAENSARQAIALDPNWALGFSALGLALEQQGRLTEARELYDQALELAPNDPDVLHLYSRLLAKVGYLEDAWAMREKLRDIDPHVGVYNSVSSWVLWLMGRDEEAIAMARDVPALHRGYTLSRILASTGDFTGAANVIESNSEGLYRPGIAEEAVRLLREAPTSEANADSPRLGLLAFVYLYAGSPEKALEPHEDGVNIGYSVAIFNAFLWHRSYRELRSTERFRAFLRNAGIIEFWEEFGWPDFCNRMENSSDFICH